MNPGHSEKKWAYAKKLGQAAVSIAFLGVILWRMDLSVLLKNTADAPVTYLVVWNFIYYVTSFFLWAVGLRALLNPMAPCGLKPVFVASIKLNVLATVIPGRLGDMGILVLLKDKYTYGQTSAVFILDKLITLVVNAVLSSLAIWVFFSAKAAVLTLAGFLLGTGLFLTAALKMPAGFFRVSVLQKVVEKLKGVRFELRRAVADPGPIVVNALATFGRFLLAGVSFQLILYWFHTPASFVHVVLIQALAQLACIVPLTIMGLGVSEAVMVTLFAKVHVSPEAVLAASLYCRAIHLVFIFLLYVFWMGKKARE